VELIGSIIGAIMTAVITAVCQAVMALFQAVLLMVLVPICVVLVVYLSMYSVVLRMVLWFLFSAGSFIYFSMLIKTVFEKTNQGPMSWRPAVYAYAMISAVLFMFADWAWKNCFGRPPFFSQWLFASCCVAWILGVNAPSGALLTHSFTHCVAWIPHKLYMVFVKTRPSQPKKLDDTHRLDKITKWDGIAGEVCGDELVSLQKFVMSQCENYADKYDFSMVLERAFKVTNSRLKSDFDEFGEKLLKKGRSGNQLQLFHGTQSSHAASIVAEGFRLPNHAGMFGKGVYFADTPLKSLQYTKTGDIGTILLCLVELGNTKIQRMANHEAEASMKSSWVMRMVGVKSFDSITAPAKPTGSLRVPEYTVFKTQQVLPQYLLCVRQTKKRRC